MTCFITKTACEIFQVDEYMEALEEIMIKREDGVRLMPELYAVPGDKVCYVDICLLIIG